MADAFLLDTSAVLTLTGDEAGASVVEELLARARSGDAALSLCAISLMELLYVRTRVKGEEAARQLVGLVKAWPLTILPIDESLLLQGGSLKAALNLGVADALIVAAAVQQGARLVHKDSELERAAALVPTMPLPYKGLKKGRPRRARNP